MIEYSEVLEASLTLLNANYIFPDKAVEADRRLRAALADGAFGGLDGPAFCEAVTGILYDVCADNHLRLLWGDEPTEEEADGDDMFEALSLSRNHGFHKVERLDGNIGYLDLRLVSTPGNAAPLFAAAMRLLANTDGMILDLRNNPGGVPETVAIICGYFLGPDVHINDVHTRSTDSTKQYWTPSVVEGPWYQDKPLYVLTAKRTHSGAEEISYNLRNTGRATLVGETTGGGAHPTEWFPITPHITFTSPNARSISPVTGTNWEGVGVEPHVAVAADEAFDVAYRALLEAFGAEPAE